MSLLPEIRVLIRGAGDLASGVAYRLKKSGLTVMMTEIARPLFVRRAVCFGNAIYEGGQFDLEGLRSVVAPDANEAVRIAQQHLIALIVDSGKEALKVLNPNVIIDARMMKNPGDTAMDDARLVIGLGPGFSAGENCHAVIETQRGHHLGRVIWQGAAAPNTGAPGTVAGFALERVLRAPQDGHIAPAPGIAIGSVVKAGTVIASVDAATITAPFDGVLRGLIHPSVMAWQGLKVGDLDPRGEAGHCFTISEKSLAVGGGVLEAILSAPALRGIGEGARAAQ